MSITARSVPWHRELNRYHWFVLIVCTLGWMFDCLDQQLFNLARPRAMADLLDKAQTDPKVVLYGAYATSILMIGWATGGIIFGIMGDRLGRARTMVFTILAYSVFTGLSGFAYTVWDFMVYRFMTGLGVGGQFAVGVSLVAEVMPDRARPYALGMLQALSAIGNVTAALISMGFGRLTEIGVVESYWRWMFAVGVLPAFLAVLVMARLKEPERWRKAVAEAGGKRKAGSIRELFGTPRWRKRAIVGMLLASAGVIGLWGIGFFSFDLNRLVFRGRAEQAARTAGDAEKDRQFVRLAIRSSQALDEVEDREDHIAPQSLLSLDPSNKDPQRLYAKALSLRAENKEVSHRAVLDALRSPEGQQPAPSAEERERLSRYLEGPEPAPGPLAEHAERILSRQKRIDGSVDFWASVTSMLFNVGAFFGIYAFSRVTQRLGRRVTFAIFFTAAMGSTAVAFLFMKSPGDVYWMVPLMGFCQLSVFGGYAIYFPELFPTRLRSTGTSLCYNIARFVSATGPLALGVLTEHVFAGFEEPMRYAGVTMCAVYFLGLAVLPFCPETKDEPLPE